MNKLPGDSSLPPGVTSKDIDGDGGETCETCDGQGALPISQCCGAEIIGEDICADCKEHTEPSECDECDGKGVIDPPTREEIEEMKADD